jgi:hypothetical protein
MIQHLPKATMLSDRQGGCPCFKCVNCAARFPHFCLAPLLGLSVPQCRHSRAYATPLFCLLLLYLRSSWWQAKKVMAAGCPRLAISAASLTAAAFASGSTPPASAQGVHALAGAKTTAPVSGRSEAPLSWLFLLNISDRCTPVSDVIPALTQRCFCPVAVSQVKPVASQRRRLLVPPGWPSPQQHRQQQHHPLEAPSCISPRRSCSRWSEDGRHCFR